MDNDKVNQSESKEKSLDSHSDTKNELKEHLIIVNEDGERALQQWEIDLRNLSPEEKKRLNDNILKACEKSIQGKDETNSE